MILKPDIAVLGGGMAGFSAAYSAAKSGRKVLLVDKRTSLGGLATGGLVMPLMGISAGNRKIVAGNMEVIMDSIKSYFPHSVDGYYFDPEAMKHSLDLMAAEAGIDLLFDTVVTGVQKEEKLIKGIEAVNKSGLCIIKADYYIDATGDADVSVMAGVPVEMGRKSDGRTQAYSLRFIIGNIDADLAEKHLRELHKNDGYEKLYKKYSAKYHVPIMDAGMQNFRIPGRKDSLAFNAPRLLDINGVDGKSLSDGYLLGRKLIGVYVRILRENVKGCEDAVVTNTAECMGIRESRRITGQYILTKEDVVEGRKFSDGICGSCWWIDIHNPTGKGVSEIIKPKGGYYDIPYRCIVSNEIHNLWIAGRCISTDHESLASARIMPTCIATGQAAGTAAAMASIDKKTVNEIDINALRNKLAEEGALITGINL